MKQISRSAGRSTTAAAAYRAGDEIKDQRTGLVHDYTRKTGVIHAELILPGGMTANRGEFWNRVEHHHKRGDAVLAREIEVSLPAELHAAARYALAIAYARELADRYQVGVDVALHSPSRHGDDRNWHAHILMTTCAVTKDGALGKKVVELDPIACLKRGPGREALPPPADRERPRWEELINNALQEAGLADRVDHRSHEARGLGTAPTAHLGPSATQSERQSRPSRIGDDNRRRLAQNQRMRDERIKLAKLNDEAPSPSPHSRQRQRRRDQPPQRHELRNNLRNNSNKPERP